jgi:transcriptional regulator of met regulon
LEEIRGRDDKDSLIILPEIHGDANFVTTFIKDVLKDYTDLSLEDLRINTTAKIVTASGKVVSPPLLTPEQLYEDIEKELPEISKKLMTELQIDVDINTIRKILNNVRDNELLEKIPPRTTTRLENLLEVIISELKNVEKPKTFEDDPAQNLQGSDVQNECTGQFLPMAEACTTFSVLCPLRLYHSKHKLNCTIVWSQSAKKRHCKSSFEQTAEGNT